MLTRTDRHRAVVAGLFALVAVGLFLGCAVGAPDEAALRGPANDALYADGIFVATYDFASQEGWRPFIQIEVKSGIVRRVCFDAVAVDGRRMLDDDYYVESHRLETGSDVRELIETLRDCLIERQLVLLTACAPETEWTAYFAQLAEAALGAARDSESGRTGSRAVTIQAPPLSMIGPYLVTDEPDELGWSAELLVTFADGVVSGADYRETRVDQYGETAIKLEETDYLGHYTDATGVDLIEAVQTLLGQLRSGATPDEIDAVAGATLTSERFIDLARRVFALRTVPALPRRLCSDNHSARR